MKWGDMSDFYLDCEMSKHGFGRYYINPGHRGSSKKPRLTYYSLNVYIKKVTNKAILFLNKQDKDIWLHLSQIGYKEDLKEHEFNDIMVPEWLCEKHGLL